MTSNLNIPKISKANKMSGMKDLVGKKMTREVNFMGIKITISKLSVSEVLSIQESAKNLEKDETEGLSLLKLVIKSSVKDAEELRDRKSTRLNSSHSAKSRMPSSA